MSSIKYNTIDPFEKEIKGEWEMIDGKIESNYNCARIEYLINHLLKRIKSSYSGWETLFLDPNSGSYWELTFPQSNLHGGGPPCLSLIENMNILREKYNLNN